MKFSRMGGIALAAGAATTLVTPTTLVHPAIASAHSVVIATSPQRGTTVPAPTQVTTTWNEPVTQVQENVTGPDGGEWSTGAVQGSGAQYSVAMRPAAPPGTYTVYWTVKSDDGDIVNGGWQFTVG